jgi:hypothetical protein
MLSSSTIISYGRLAPDNHSENKILPLPIEDLIKPDLTALEDLAVKKKGESFP